MLLLYFLQNSLWFTAHEAGLVMILGLMNVWHTIWLFVWRMSHVENVKICSHSSIGSYFSLSLSTGSKIIESRLLQNGKRRCYQRLSTQNSTLRGQLWTNRWRARQVCQRLMNMQCYWLCKKKSHEVSKFIVLAWQSCEFNKKKKWKNHGVL